MIQTLNALKQNLETDGNIHLVNFNLFPPIAATELARIENMIRLPPFIKSFYLATNGWQVRWFYRTNPHHTPDDFPKNEPFDWMWPAEHYWQMDGVINMLPLELLLHKDWKDFIWFDFEQQFEITYKNKDINLATFKQAVKPFDIFDKYFTAAFYIGDDDMPVLMGEDHNVEFLAYEPVSFERYLDILITSRGEVKSRMASFKKINS